MDGLDGLPATAAAVNAAMATRLTPARSASPRLWQAMRHAGLAGGKRLRPYLAIKCAALWGVPIAAAMPTAVAVEFVHCYSLIHDDLPAMDDARMRRGRPSLHRAFDEATAILAGDALLNLAFETLADPATAADPARRCALVLELARASGATGMIAGQMLDMLAETVAFDQRQTETMQGLKTGALINAACQCGAILGSGEPAARAALANYASHLGLAFQIADDLLDARDGNPEHGDQGEEDQRHDSQGTGKDPGRDAAAGKATFVTLLGPAAARQAARNHAAQAVQALAGFAKTADCLRQAALYAATRTR